MLSESGKSKYLFLFPGIGKPLSDVEYCLGLQEIYCAEVDLSIPISFIFYHVQMLHFNQVPDN